MTGYELTFITRPLTDSLEENILDAFGGMVGTTHTGEYYVTIEVPGNDALEVAKAAHMELLGLGVVVCRLEYDLVNRTQIAERLETTPQAVGNWIRGARRSSKHDPFPTAFNEVNGGVWLWADVVHWIHRTVNIDAMDGVELLTREQIVEFNACLFRNYEAAEPMFEYPSPIPVRLSTDLARPHGGLMAFGGEIVAHSLFRQTFVRAVEQRGVPWEGDLYFADLGVAHSLPVMWDPVSHNPYEVDSDEADRVDH